MAQKTLNPSEIVAVLGAIDPDANTAATHSTGWISMSNFQALLAIIMAGTLGRSAKLNAKLQQATSASGTGAKDIPGAAITELTQAGSDNDKQAIIECWAENLDLANNFTYVRLSMTVAVATSDCGAVVLGMNPRYGPASDHDAETVDEIVTV